MKSLNELRNEAHANAVAHGFKDASIGEDAALMHSELSEMLEDYRSGHLAHETFYEESIPVFAANGSPLAIDGSVYVEGGDQKRLMVAVRHKEAYAVTDVNCGVCDGRGSFLAAVADREPSVFCSTCNGTGKKLRRFKPCGIPSELADVVIRVLHFSGKHGVDIGKAVDEKMAFNRDRTFMHGGKKI